MDSDTLQAIRLKQEVTKNLQIQEIKEIQKKSSPAIGALDLKSNPIIPDEINEASLVKDAVSYLNLKSENGAEPLETTGDNVFLHVDEEVKDPQQSQMIYRGLAPGRFDTMASDEITVYDKETGVQAINLKKSYEVIKKLNSNIVGSSSLTEFTEQLNNTFRQQERIKELGSYATKQDIEAVEQDKKLLESLPNPFPFPDIPPASVLEGYTVRTEIAKMPTLISDTKNVKMDTSVNQPDENSYLKDKINAIIETSNAISATVAAELNSKQTKTDGKKEVNHEENALTKSLVLTPEKAALLTDLIKIDGKGKVDEDGVMSLLSYRSTSNLRKRVLDMTKQTDQILYETEHPDQINSETETKENTNNQTNVNTDQHDTDIENSLDGYQSISFLGNSSIMSTKGKRKPSKTNIGSTGVIVQPKNIKLVDRLKLAKVQKPADLISSKIIKNMMRRAKYYGTINIEESINDIDLHNLEIICKTEFPNYRSTISNFNDIVKKSTKDDDSNNSTLSHTIGGGNTTQTSLFSISNSNKKKENTGEGSNQKPTTQSQQQQNTSTTSHSKKKYKKLPPQIRAPVFSEDEFPFALPNGITFNCGSYLQSPSQNINNKEAYKNKYKSNINNLTWECDYTPMIDLKNLPDSTALLDSRTPTMASNEVKSMMKRSSIASVLKYTTIKPQNNTNDKQNNLDKQEKEFDQRDLMYDNRMLANIECIHDLTSSLNITPQDLIQFLRSAYSYQDFLRTAYIQYEMYMDENKFDKAGQLLTSLQALEVFMETCFERGVRCNFDSMARMIISLRENEVEQSEVVTRRIMKFHKWAALVQMRQLMIRAKMQEKEFFAKIDLNNLIIKDQYISSYSNITGTKTNFTITITDILGCLQIPAIFDNQNYGSGRIPLIKSIEFLNSLAISGYTQSFSISNKTISQNATAELETFKKEERNSNTKNNKESSIKDKIDYSTILNNNMPLIKGLSEKRNDHFIKVNKQKIKKNETIQLTTYDIIKRDCSEQIKKNFVLRLKCIDSGSLYFILLILTMLRSQHCVKFEELKKTLAERSAKEIMIHQAEIAEIYEKLLMELNILSLMMERRMSEAKIRAMYNPTILTQNSSISSFTSFKNARTDDYFISPQQYNDEDYVNDSDDYTYSYEYYIDDQESVLDLSDSVLESPHGSMMNEEETDELIENSSDLSYLSLSESLDNDNNEQKKNENNTNENEEETQTKEKKIKNINIRRLMSNKLIVMSPDIIANEDEDPQIKEERNKTVVAYYMKLKKLRQKKKEKKLKLNKRLTCIARNTISKAKHMSLNILQATTDLIKSDDISLDQENEENYQMRTKTESLIALIDGDSSFKDKKKKDSNKIDQSIIDEIDTQIAKLSAPLKAKRSIKILAIKSVKKEMNRNSVPVKSETIASGHLRRKRNRVKRIISVTGALENTSQENSLYTRLKAIFPSSLPHTLPELTRRTLINKLKRKTAHLIVANPNAHMTYMNSPTHQIYQQSLATGDTESASFSKRKNEGSLPEKPAKSEVVHGMMLINQAGGFLFNTNTSTHIQFVPGEKCKYERTIYQTDKEEENDKDKRLENIVFDALI